MISTTGISLSFGSQKLFEDVNVRFLPGNCYGLIGANGAGKSTFLKILSGEVEASKGLVHMVPGKRLAMLRQDHFRFEETDVLTTVLMGNERLYAVMKEKDTLYAKPDFSEADGERASELEAQFAELNGWEAESDAALMLAGLGLGTEYLTKLMKELTGGEKVKVLLAQALFGQPDVLLLDEPTNNLDIYAIRWLENFLLNFENTVVVVSHDRHFMNKVCTHIADVDFGRITTYSGNYEFWKRSAELAMRLRADEKKKNSDKAEELKQFIARFGANASKARQTTSRAKQLEKLDLSDLPVSTRKQPWVGFEPKREAGRDILTVENISKTIDGVPVLRNVSFTVKRGDKIAFIGADDVAKTTLFKILGGEMEPDSGHFTLGGTITLGYFPKDNSSYFSAGEYSLIDWLMQYAPEPDEAFIRGFLGKMLFTRDEALKKTNVLSGGERVRVMLSKLMLSQPNLLILDEPTGHLDLEAITSLNDGLARFKGMILFASQDHELVNTVATRLIDLNPAAPFDKDMTFDEYIEMQAELKAAAAKAARG